MNSGGGEGCEQSTTRAVAERHRLVHRRLTTVLAELGGVLGSDDRAVVARAIVRELAVDWLLAAGLAFRLQALDVVVAGLRAL